MSAALDALDIGPGDEVIVPGYTCVVVANAVRYRGAVPVFCDIELDTFGLDADCLQPLLTGRTAAIVVQHLYGLVSRDLDRLVQLARERDIPIIEDCAHATGASYRGTRVGNFGDIAFYSSEQSKVLSTTQGGWVTTNSERLAMRLEKIWHETRPPDATETRSLLTTLIGNYLHNRSALLGDLFNVFYGAEEAVSTTDEEILGHEPAGYIRRMATPCATIASQQLSALDGINAQRRDSAARWTEACSTLQVDTAMVIADSEPTFLRYPVMLRDARRKTDWRWQLETFNCVGGDWFRSHLHPSDLPVDNCPAAAEAVARCINLPTMGMSFV